MIHHPIVLGAKAILLLIIIVILVILHGILTPEQFRIAVKIGIAVFVAAVFIIWTVFFMMLNNPNSRLHKHMVLTTASDQTAEEKKKEHAELAALIGVEGVAETNLRPSGIGRFGGELIDVVSDRTFIEKDQRIVVIAVEGKKVKVKKLET